MIETLKDLRKEGSQKRILFLDPIGNIFKP